MVEWSSSDRKVGVKSTIGWMERVEFVGRTLCKLTTRKEGHCNILNVYVLLKHVYLMIFLPVELVLAIPEPLPPPPVASSPSWQSS